MKSARAGQWSRFVRELGFVIAGTLFVTTMGCGSATVSEESEDRAGEGNCTAGACAWNGGETLEEGAEKPRLADPAQTFVKGRSTNGATCTVNEQCASGFCADGVCCNAQCDHWCMACSAAKKGSGVDGVCGSIAFGTDPDNECPTGSCDGGNMCRSVNGHACSSFTQCLSGSCVDGVCCDNACMGGCSACSAAKKGGGEDGTCGLIAAGTNPDNECVGGACNGAGACSVPQTPVGNAAACSSSAQCASGFCVDGVCCDSECSGTCDACTAAKKGSGSDGTCGPIAYDTDPDEECWAGACTGGGECKYYNGVPCGSTTECLSNYCADGYCCGNICTQGCYACSTAKKGYGYNGACEPIAMWQDPENECANGACDGTGQCMGLLDAGNACASNDQCSSGYCVDGVCCDNECNGDCVACTAAKKGSGADGTCGPIAYDTDPEEECWGGGCDGAGQCKYYNGLPCTSTDQCLSNYCADGFCCGNICTDTCVACSNAKKGYGFDGVCEPVEDLTDPDNECANGTCDGAGLCSTTIGNGSLCNTAADCDSGHCVDGVCCDNVCNDPCMACNVPGIEGTCAEASPGACSSTWCSGLAGFPGLPAVMIGGSPSDVDMADFNGDGKSDLVVGGTDAGGVEVLFNNGNGTFTSQGNYQMGGREISLATADLNGDRKADIVTANRDMGTVSVRLNNGLGVFIVNTDYAAGTYPQSVKLADLTGDGKPEIITANAGSGRVSVLRNLGNGTFGAKTEYGDGHDVASVALADFNGDGSRDMVVTGPGYLKARVFFNQGNGLFGAPALVSLPNVANMVDAADFDGDGKPEIIVTDFARVVVLHNNGNGTFDAGTSYATSIQAVPFDVTTTDVNGDGKLDLLAASGGVEIHVNNGNGTFAAPVRYSSGDAPFYIAAADVSGDGKTDIAVLNRVDGMIDMLLNQGDGTFPTRPGLIERSIGYAATAADFNRDGRPDLVYSNSQDSRVEVLLQLGNGTFGPRISSPTSFGPAAVAAGDLNGDSFPDVVTIGYNSAGVLFGQGDGNMNFMGGMSVGTDPRGVALVDVTRDAKLDILVANNGPSTFSMLRNQGGGVIVGQVVYATALNPEAITGADFNGDGAGDVAVIGVNAMAVHINNGDGTFAPRVEYPVGSKGTSIAAADLDRDGDVDLIIAGTYGPSVFMNNGNGTFAARVDHRTTTDVHYILVQDFDGDERPDIVVSNRNTFSATLLLNQGNGIFGQRRDFVGASQAISIAAADFNVDGKTDLVLANILLLNTCLQ